MLFSFDALESLPFFNKLPFTSKQKRLLGAALLLTSSLWVFVITVFIFIRTGEKNEITDNTQEIVDTVSIVLYEYSDLEIEALLSKTEQLINEKQFYSAGSLLEKLSYVEEPSLRQKLITAKLLIKQERLADARKILSRLREHHSRNEDIAILYIQTFSASELSPPKWQEYVKEFTETPEMLTTVAELLSKEMPMEALPLLQESYKWNSRNGKTNFLLGKLYALDLPVKNLKLSQKHLSHAVNLAEDSGHYHSSYALTLHTRYEDDPEAYKPHFSLAEYEYKKSLDLSPTSCATLYNLGELYSLKKEFHKNAETCFKQALEIEEDFWQAQFKLGLLYLENKKYVGAIEMFENALKNSDSNVRILHQLAVAYEKSGNSNMALTTYEQILKITPKDDIALYKITINK